MALENFDAFAAASAACAAGVSGATLASQKCVTSCVERLKQLPGGTPMGLADLAVRMMRAEPSSWRWQGAGCHLVSAAADAALDAAEEGHEEDALGIPAFLAADKDAFADLFKALLAGVRGFPSHYVVQNCALGALSLILDPRLPSFPINGNGRCSSASSATIAARLFTIPGFKCLECVVAAVRAFPADVGVQNAAFNIFQNLSESLLTSGSSADAEKWESTVVPRLLKAGLVDAAVQSLLTILRPEGQGPARSDDEWIDGRAAVTSHVSFLLGTSCENCEDGDDSSENDAAANLVQAVFIAKAANENLLPRVSAALARALVTEVAFWSSDAVAADASLLDDAAQQPVWLLPQHCFSIVIGLADRAGPGQGQLVAAAAVTHAFFSAGGQHAVLAVLERMLSPARAKTTEELTAVGGGFQMLRLIRGCTTPDPEPLAPDFPGGQQQLLEQKDPALCAGCARVASLGLRDWDRHGGGTPCTLDDGAGEAKTVFLLSASSTLYEALQDGSSSSRDAFVASSDGDVALRAAASLLGACCGGGLPVASVALELAASTLNDPPATATDVRRAQEALICRGLVAAACKVLGDRARVV